MTTTTELLNQGLELLLQLEEVGGELTEEYMALVSTWMEGTGDKLGGIYFVRQQTRGQMEILREEEKRLANRRRGMEKLLDHLNSSALSLLKQREAFGEEPKVKTSTYTAWLQSSKSVALEEGVTIEEVPESYRIPQPDRLDKAAAKKTLASGMGIHGLKVIESESVRWR